MREAPLTSIHHRPQQLNILEISLRRILYKVLSYCMASRGSHLQKNYFPLLTGRIILSNKKKKFEKLFSIFLKHFQKKLFTGSVMIGWLVNKIHQSYNLSDLPLPLLPKNVKFVQGFLKILNLRITTKWLFALKSTRLINRSISATCP